MLTDQLFTAPLFEIGVFFFGLLIGSFLNVVIYRLPAKLEHEWRCQCEELLELPPNADQPPPSMIWGRSYCPSCDHQITALENVPLISWVLLRGKCSSCSSSISLRYPFVELLTGLTFLVVFLTFGPTVQGLAAAVLTALLIALSGIDFDHHLLPDNLTLTLLWIGLALSLVPVFASPVNAIIGAIAGYLSLWFVFRLFLLVTGKEGMGFGDFKLLAALGAWLGWQMLPLIILTASISGIALAATHIIRDAKTRKEPIPFGPALALAGWIAMLWGNDILDLYLRFSGLAHS